MKWLRVSKQNRCAACGRSDWCKISEDGKACLCMRVVSDKPVQFTIGWTGYIHHVNGSAPVMREKPRPEPVINSTKLLCEWRESNEARPVTILAEKLGVAPSSLLAIGATWAPPHRAWGFPMKTGHGSTVGIRLRSDDGFKWAVRGSHSGLFIPDVRPEKLLILTEGPTNVAAGLTLGYFTIGIPSAGGGIPDLCAAIRRLGIRQVAIICDNKDGDISFRSNPTIQNHLPVPSCLVVLPSKDIRSYLQLGGNAALLESIIGSVTWKQPTNETLN